MNKLTALSSRFLSDENLQLITGQVFVGQSILVAYELGLFQLISKKGLSAQNIAKHLNLKERAAQAIISSSCALGLIEYNNGEYQLSHLGKMYLDKESPEYYGKVLDLFIQEHKIMNYSSIRKAILSSKSQVNEGKDLFANSEGLGNTENFIASLHYKAFKPAFFWAKMVGLNKHKKFVDIGGGSGIHTIAACLNNPKLSGLVCDRQSVIPYTKTYIQNFDLENRIDLVALDMWKDSFPKGDVYFFGDIFHDWKKEKCAFLAKKCFQLLPRNGLIILHEMLFTDDKAGPFLTSAYNMKMMIWTEGQQFSCAEVRDLLREAGFKEVCIKKSLGNWSIVIGVKK